MANESYSVYPGDIDGYATLPLRRDEIDEIRAADVNRLRDAIVKIEQELGTNPSGNYATVRDRLDSIGDAGSLIAAHLADTEDAHDASSISVDDDAASFYGDNVEEVLTELTYMLPHRPDKVGENISYVPNDGIPSFVDGYGTKFIYNITEVADDTFGWNDDEDNALKRTQFRAVRGLRGLHVVEVGEGNDNGTAYIEYTPTGGPPKWARYKAPFDGSFGEAQDVSTLVVGDTITLESSTTTKRIRLARTSDTLPVATVVEKVDIYGLEAVDGYFSHLSNGFQRTTKITRTATSKTATSRNQFVVSGIVYPADEGTLVLQRKRRAPVAGDNRFYPIAVLNLKNIFDENRRATYQPVYVPELEDFDAITLYDRQPARNRFQDLDVGTVDGQQLYENYDITYPSWQMAKYVIPVSNPYIVAGSLGSPASLADVDAYASSYRIVHYKNGITDFIGDPLSANIYSVNDPIGVYSDDGDNTVRMSNIFVDSNNTRPAIDKFYIQHVPTAAEVPVPGSPWLSPRTLPVPRKKVSGITYSDNYDVFDIILRSNRELFNKTFVVKDILKFSSQSFNFPNGTSHGHWGDAADLQELVFAYKVTSSPDGYVTINDDITNNTLGVQYDGYSKFELSVVPSNVPEYDGRAYYVAKSGFSNGYEDTGARRISPIANTFSNNAFITATLFDPFGPGASVDAYGDSSMSRILVTYRNSRSTSVTEYFTDEDKRVGAFRPKYPGEDTIGAFNHPSTDDWLREDFIFATKETQFTCDDGYNVDGYRLAEWNPGVPLTNDSLQCGGRFEASEIDVAGLIYPQSNYTTADIFPGQLSGLPDYSPDGYWAAGPFKGDLIYQRLFSLGYPVNSARLNIKSGGANPISFTDISFDNVNRFAKVEVKIPGTGTDSSGWLDVGRLFENGRYTDGYGALNDAPIGGAGDITVPFTFGIRNNANAGNMIAVRVTYFGNTPSQRIESKKRIITMLELLSSEY